LVRGGRVESRIEVCRSAYAQLVRLDMQMTSAVMLYGRNICIISVATTI
jgi:hypothetical protein